jgi:hypothetical protein
VTSPGMHDVVDRSACGRKFCAGVNAAIRLLWCVPMRRPRRRPPPLPPPTPTPPLLLMRASSAMVLVAVPVTTAMAARRVSTDVCYVCEAGRGWVDNSRGKPYGCGLGCLLATNSQQPVDVLGIDDSAACAAVLCID